MGYRLEQCTDEGDTISSAVAPEQTLLPRTASATLFLVSEKLREIKREIDYADRRIANPTEGEKALLGMRHLGGAFRFIEKLYAEGQISFLTRRLAGNLICDRYEDLRADAFMYSFSRDNRRNEGCV